MIRVIIERKLNPGKEIEFSQITSELRSRAMYQPGYVSGETWVGNADHLYSVIITTWLSAELWETWENSPERHSITERLEPLLAAPVRTVVLRHPGEVEVSVGYLLSQLGS